MDDPTIDPREYRDVVRALARFNRFSGIARTLWRCVEPLARQDRGGRPLAVLDVGTGGGDIPIAMAKLAARRGYEVEIEGCDLSPLAVDCARRAAERAGLAIRFYVLDACRDRLPRDYDVAVSNLLLHHLDDEQVLALLGRLGGAGIHQAHCDLHRCRSGLVLAWLGTRLLSRSRITHVDGPMSVRRALRPDEAMAFARRAGMSQPRVRRVWPVRFVLEGGGRG